MSSTSTAVARESLPNSSTRRLLVNETFTGVTDSVGAFTKVGVAVMANVEIELTIYQGGNGVFWDKITTYTIPSTSAPEPQTPFECPRVVTALTHRFFYITARNTSESDASFTRIHSQVFNDGYLDSSTDNVLVYGADADEVKRKLLTDEDGRLIVNVNGGGGSSVVEVSNFPAVQNVSVDNFPAYQPSIEVSNFPAIQEVSGEVSVSNYSPFSGTNTDFAFYPDATNSTSAIYADGQQPTATNQAGWVYTNNGTAPNKINWYVFQDVTLPQYRVDEMESIYFVISQITPATTLPFVSFYTMPNGIDDVVPNFAKSKLVFAPSGAVPTTQGEYLFYVKTDPTTIRPEITERYELTFVEAQSSKTLLQASGERLSLSTLSTGSTDPAGSNYFLFQQYGIQWAKTTVRLPVDNDRLLTTETNSSAISTTLTSLNGKVTACDTGAISGNVTLTGTDVEMNSTPTYNTLVAVNGKIISCDTGNVTLSNTLGIKSFPATNTIVKRAISTVANALLSINYYNDAGSINFILLYDLPVASVTVGTTPPIAVFALSKNQGDTIELHRLLVGSAITLAVAGDYDGTAVPHGAGAYLTVSTLTSNF